MRYIYLYLILAIFSANCRGMGESPRRAAAEFDLQGHRGARGLAPENTWPAFEKALEYKMTTLELDTVLTKDGVQVVHHDAETNPAICLQQDSSPIEKKKISEITWAELSTLDCGSLLNPKFPQQKLHPGIGLLTLPQFFEKFREYEKKHPHAQNVQFNIETKFYSDDQASPEEMQRFAEIASQNFADSGYAKRITVQSFVIDVLPLVKARLPQVRTSALFAPSRYTGLKMYLGFGVTERTEILERAEKVSADIISPYFLFSTADFNRMAHAKGFLVIPWTVNDEEEMRLQIKAGVDGLISDYPDRLRKVADEQL